MRLVERSPHCQGLGLFVDLRAEAKLSRLRLLVHRLRRSQTGRVFGSVAWQFAILSAISLVLINY